MTLYFVRRLETNITKRGKEIPILEHQGVANDLAYDLDEGSVIRIIIASLQVSDYRNTFL